MGPEVQPEPRMVSEVGGSASAKWKIIIKKSTFLLNNVFMK
jgi:hypothetical protein